MIINFKSIMNYNQFKVKSQKEREKETKEKIRNQMNYRTMNLIYKAIMNYLKI